MKSERLWLAGILTLSSGAGAAPVQESAVLVRRGADPLHRVADIDIGEEVPVVEFIARRDGALHIWASSKDVDPSLRVESLSGSSPPAEDDDGGGGSTAWVLFKAAEGEPLRISISPTGVEGRVELHVVAAPESETTRELASFIDDEVRELTALAAPGDLRDARERIDLLFSELEGIAEMRTSEAAAEALWELGFATSQRGWHDLTAQIQRWVLEHYERVLPESHGGRLIAEQNLALTYSTAGDNAHALEHYEQLLQVQRRLRPEDDPTVLLLKQDVGFTLRLLGRVEEALIYEEEVHATRERLLPPGHPALLDAKANLGATRRLLGDIEGAHSLFEAVHLARSRQLGGDDPLLLMAKTNLGVSHLLLGEIESAHALFQYVDEAWERLSMGDREEAIIVKSNLATTSRELGDTRRSRELDEIVYEARKRQLPGDHPRLLEAKGNLAASLGESGDLAGSLALYEEVHSAMVEVLPVQHATLLETKHNLGLIRAATGDLDGAVSLSRDIVAAQVSSLRRGATTAPRVARTASRDAVRRVAHARIWEAASDEGFERLCFEVLETARYVSTAPFLARISELEGEEARETRGRLSEADLELDGLISTGPLGSNDKSVDADHVRAWRAEVRAAAQRRDRAQEELLALVGDEIEVRLRSESVASKLPADHAVIAINRLDRWRWDETALDASVVGTYYLAYVLKAGGEPVPIDLGPADDLERLILNWRRSIGAPLPTVSAGDRVEDSKGEEVPASTGARGLGLGVDAGENEVSAGRALTAALFTPILEATEVPVGATLHVALSDAIFTVPLDALPLDESAGPGPIECDVLRLGDLFDVQYETSLMRLTRPAPAERTASSILLVGGVDFDGVEAANEVDSQPERDIPMPRGMDDAQGLGFASWKALPGTSIEIEAVARLARDCLDADIAQLRGQAVTESALAEASRGKQVVHLATHGWFLPENVRSILNDRPESTSDLLGNRSTVTGFAPLTLCGLVLSGANTAETPEQRASRYLAAQELRSFDLRECDLAVLSACSTNVSIARAGQCIQSLQIALHMAGARRSLTSLWSVPDRPTQSLMERFYSHLWESGASAPAALWSAKCDLRRAGSSPRLWAGWVLAHDAE
ncbi:MAG: CHAT domain-containing tetratricopeptide repeat protein [Planctomycetota bacterium]